MEQVIQRLDLKDDKHLYSQLYRIRSEYIKDEAGIKSFLKVDGIKKMVELLAVRVERDSVNDKTNDKSTSEVNDKMTEVLLSILGNCTCNNVDAAIQAFESRVIEYLISLVNRSGNAAILSKACRLIGNLAQFPKIAFALQSNGIALAVSNCLTEDASTSVLTMAVRVIRLMWNVKKFRVEILSFGSIYKIMVVLYKMLKSTEKPEEVTPESDFVILKRQHEPDRAISKEKLSLLIERMKKNEVEINFEIKKPEKRANDAFNLPAEKENLELVAGILKCLLTMTATTIPQVARSVYAEGFGILCLVFLAGETCKYRAMSLQIISRLSSNAQAQEYLAVNNDLITDVASLLLNADTLEKPLETAERKFCINILCLSSESACSRGKLRRSGVFKSLLDIANTSRSEKEMSLLIFTFFQFRFDQLGLDTLLQLGFINVLIKILDNLIEKMDVDHIKFDDPSLDEERKEEQKQKQRKRSMVEPPVSFNSYWKHMRYDPGSPSSSSGDYTWVPPFSPGRSSGYSPISSPSRSYQDYDDSDSDIYSPVCSDNEEEAPVKEDFDILTFLYENDEIGAEEKPVASDDEMSNMTPNEDGEDETEGSKDDSPKRSDHIPETLKAIEDDPLQHVLQLLWKVSIKSSHDPAFVRPTNLSTLHKVAQLVQRPNGKVFQTMENIFTQTRNFVPILKQNFVFKIRELSRPSYGHQNCYSCSKMKVISRDLLRAYGTIAESGYGRGEIAHFLLTADEDMKKKVAISLTYTISNPDFLNDMLFRLKALDIILDTIFNERDLAAEACDGLTIMANNLNIQIPSDDDVLQNIIPDDYLEDETLWKSEDEQIKFVLKDGETSFSKEALKKSSEVFNSMLSGDFRENCQNEVKFAEYTVEGMKYFFQMLATEQSGKLKPIAPKVKDMNVILTSYELSILYILTKIQKPLLNVIKIVLDETSVQKIFEWSLRNINQDLLISAICYFLCGDIDGPTKLKLFLEANQSQYKNEWKQLLVDTLLMKCQSVL